MSKQIKITSVEQFILFMEKEKLNSKQICNLLEKIFILYGDEKKAPDKLIKEFKEYYQRFSNIKEKPLFLDKS
ncbi:hypothetical protein [Mesonia sp.]|uniref:hypothetical protein n=1 Tax=Mesonia sp. TaxID=1960830 RepID=UPI003F94D3E8